MTQPTDPWIGRKLGRYTLRRRLGGGGGGAVYAAEDEKLQREVALKVLVPLPGASAESMERFQQEARLAARLNHPNIVPIYDVGEDAGVYYIAMRLLPGKTLGDRLNTTGTLALAEAIQVTLPLADALAYAHERGIVHRDLKPANVLFDDEERPMLVDFGIAKTLNPDGKPLTMTGTTIGTPPYMSPEQAAGEPLDHRSDIYSLGILLYQMVTGRPPFQGNAPTVMQAHLFEPPPPPSQLRPTLSRDMETIILKALAKRPEDRFTDANEMAEALRAVMRGEPTRINLPPATGYTRPSSAAGATRAAPPAYGATYRRPDPATPPPRTAAPYPPRGSAPPPRGPAGSAPTAQGGGFPIWSMTVLLLLFLCTAGAVATAALYLPDLNGGTGGSGEPIVVGGVPTATATMTAEPTATPTETPTPEPEATKAEPTEGPTPTEEPTPEPEATDTPTATPEPTETPAPTPTATLAPSATPEPTITPQLSCPAEVDGVFSGFYDRALMGCPTAAAYTANGAYQQFDSGFMLHDPTVDLIYVFDERQSRWRQFPDPWNEGDAEFPCEEAEENGGPIRGFGAVWCANPDVREALGGRVTGEIINPLTFQTAQEALLINVPARATRLALFPDRTYIER